MWIKVLLSPNTWMGAAAAALIVGSWSVLYYGPKQYNAGGTAREAELIKNFNAAIGDLEDEADKADYERVLCIGRGGLYDFATGKCTEG